MHWVLSASTPHSSLPMQSETAGHHRGAAPGNRLSSRLQVDPRHRRGCSRPFGPIPHADDVSLPRCPHPLALRVLPHPPSSVSSSMSSRACCSSYIWGSLARCHCSCTRPERVVWGFGWGIVCAFEPLPSTTHTWCWPIFRTLKNVVLLSKSFSWGTMR